MKALEQVKITMSWALQLGKDCKSVAKWASLSRMCIFALQVLSNLLIPDHAGSMQDVMMKTHRYPPHDTITEILGGGFDNWDSEYFIYVAQNGYNFLQAMAFFPLYPMCMWMVGRTFLFPLSYVLTERSLFLLAGVLINFAMFPLAAVSLYLLTLFITENRKLSLLTALLFCVNPASVFMSAVYTECLFSLFTFTGLCFLSKKYCWTASIFFGLAVATRANGIVLLGFIVYHHCNELYWQLSTYQGVMWLAAMIVRGFETLLQAVIVAFPFLLFQLYGYWKFCSIQSSSSEEIYEWCQWAIPMPYIYIQEHYWNNGFLRYFQLKQVPNFLLAFPVFGLSLYSLWIYFVTSQRKLIQLKQTFVLRPYIFHFMFLLLFGTLNMHIQVLTRFLCSSSPVLYWFAAVTAYQALTVSGSSSLSSSVQPIRDIYFILTSQHGSHRANYIPFLVTKITLLYFVTYILLGCILHCNFYPWT